MKKPVSVLVLVHTPDLDILLLERVGRPGFWQSVTGSQEGEEPLRQTAARELAEETGLQVDPQALEDWHLSNRFRIMSQWRHRYAPGVTENVEHVFSLQLAHPRPAVNISDEHLGFAWLPWPAAAQAVFSWSNRDAILMLAQRARPV